MNDQKPYPLPLCPDVQAVANWSSNELTGTLTFSDPAFKPVHFITKPIDRHGLIREVTYLTHDDMVIGTRFVSRFYLANPLTARDLLQGLEIKSPTPVRCCPKKSCDDDNYKRASFSRSVKLSAYTNHTILIQKSKRIPTARLPNSVSTCFTH